jgi:hypothetical protein
MCSTARMQRQPPGSSAWSKAVSFNLTWELRSLDREGGASLC